MTNLLEAALSARLAGVSIVPVELPGKRPPAGIKWDWRQERLPDEATIRADLAGRNGNTGLAIIGGAISKNLEILDFDLAGEFYAPFVSNLEAEAPGLISRLSIQQTQNEGFHAIYRCPQATIPGNRKLAHKAVEVGGPGEHEHRGKQYTARQHSGKWFIYPCAIETRGEGGYAVAAPSPGYAVIQIPETGNFYDFPKVTPAERETLLRCAKVLDEKPPDKVENGPLPSTGNASGLKPGEDFCTRGNVLEILLRHGWKQAGGNSERQQLTRPGKEKGISATLYDGRTLHNFSANAPLFEMDKSYSAFAVFALLEHGGDFAAAARELGRQGYGDQTREKPEESRGDQQQAQDPQGTEPGQRTESSRPAVEVCEEPEPEDQAEEIPAEAFPFHVMTGAAGNYADVLGALIEAPAQFIFFAYLTCLGSVLSPTLRLKSVLPCQPRSYTLLMGPSGISRKSTAASNVVEFFCETVSGFKVAWGVGSAEGLERILKPAEDGSPACALLCFDEMKSFVSKCGIDSSVLLPAVNTLFESNRFESHIKKGSIKLEKAHLSVLAATTLATYERMYSPAFLDIGFVNRVFIVPGAGERKNPIPPELPTKELILLKTELREVLQHVGTGLELTLTPEAEERYNRWYFDLERSSHATRLDTYSRRFMVLLAANSFKRVIDLETVEQALALCDWQLEMRRLYDPIKADSRFAEMEEKIRRVLRARTECTAVELRRFTNAKGAGLYVFKTALRNLEEAEEVEIVPGKKRYRLKGI